MLARLQLIFVTGRPARDVVIKMGGRPARTVNLPWMVDINRPELVRSDSCSMRAADACRHARGSNATVIFAMVGRLAKEKGVDIGLQAFAELANKANVDVGMIIAGGGPDENDLRVQAQDLGIGDRIAFLGWLEPHEVHHVFLASDVIVHPARWDPYPIVVLDAMAWGKPLIASSACGNVPDRVIDGVNGYSVEPGDVKTLAKLMLDLAHQGNLRARVGDAARFTAEKWPQSRTADILVEEISKFQVSIETRPAG